MHAERTLGVPSESQGELYIELLFREKEDGVADENTAVPAATRFTQDPELRLTSGRSEHAVRLGKVTITNGFGAGVTLAEREYSGLRLPGPGGGSYALRAVDGSDVGWAELGCSLRVTGGAAVAGDAAIEGRLRVTGGVEVAGDAAVEGRLRVTGGVEVAGDAAVEGRLRVTGGAEVAGDVAVAGRLLTARVAIGSTVQGQGLWDIGVREGGALSLSRNGPDNHKVWVTPEGNVGVGTREPQAKLHVRVDASPGRDSFMVYATESWGDGVKRACIGSGADSPIMIRFPYVPTGTIALGTQTTFWDIGTRGGGGFSLSLKGANDHKLWVTEDGNVGIGTTSPQAKLHVSGNVRVDGAVSAILQGTLYETGTLRPGESVGRNINGMYKPSGNVGIAVAFIGAHSDDRSDNAYAAFVHAHGYGSYNQYTILAQRASASGFQLSVGEILTFTNGSSQTARWIIRSLPLIWNNTQVIGI